MLAEGRARRAGEHGGRHPPRWRVPTVVLDATPRTEVLSRWWPRLVVKLAGSVATFPDAVYVRQVFDRDASYRFVERWIAGIGLARLAGYIEANHRQFGQAGGSLVVVPKFLEEALLGHWHGQPPPGLELAHFGALRGQDRWGRVSWSAVCLPPVTAGRRGSGACRAAGREGAAPRGIRLRDAGKLAPPDRRQGRPGYWTAEGRARRGSRPDRGGDPGDGLRR